VQPFAQQTTTLAAATKSKEQTMRGGGGDEGALRCGKGGGEVAVFVGGGAVA
jgi:hypothetical protein